MSMLAIFAVQCDVMWCNAKSGCVLFDGKTPRSDGVEGGDGVVSRKGMQ